MTASACAKLDFAMYHPTPLIVHPDEPRLLLKMEGGGINYGHKFRSAAYLVRRALQQGHSLAFVADRSSGSWAMGLAWAVHVAGGRSCFVTVGEPPAYVRSFVEAHRGSFVVVSSNFERLVALANLAKEGAWVPDQHDNPILIEAFAETIGAELALQCGSMGFEPTHIVAPVGTGGLLAGVARALRAHGHQFTAVGVDLASSLVHVGPRTWLAHAAKARGVGSEDEICGTLLSANQEIDRIEVENVFAALEQILSFTHSLPASIGMSGGLALARALRILECGDARTQILVLLPDRGETYTSELAKASAIFGDLPLQECMNA